MTFSFILTGSWLFWTFYAFYFLPLVSLSVEKQSSLCVWGLLSTSSQGSKYRKPSKGVFLGVIINKISSWVPEEDGLPRAQRISNRGALLAVCTHITSCRQCSVFRKQITAAKVGNENWQNSHNVFGLVLGFFFNFILVYKILFSSLLFLFWPFEKYIWFLQSWRIASFPRVRSRGKNTRSPTPFKICELHLTLNSSIQPSKPSKVMYLPKCRTESD